VSPAGTSDRALFSYASFHDTFPQFIAHPIAIAFSRVTTGAHFPADVFVGSALGFVIARYDVLQGQ